MFLLDIPPDPVSGGPVVALVLLAIVVLILTATLIVAFVFLLKWLNRRKVAGTGSGVAVQASSPNQ